MRKGKVVFLNGASSSGKSSIAQAIKVLDTSRNWLSTGTDETIQMAPARCIGFDPSARGGWYFVNKFDNDGNLVVEIEIGPFGWKMYEISVSVAQTMVSVAGSLVIDEIVFAQYDKKLLRLYIDALRDFDTYFVGVHCSLAQILEREQLRGNRSIGLARAQYNSAHQEPRLYDLEIDTTNNTPFECAKKILDFVAQNDNPTAFRALDKIL